MTNKTLDITYTRGLPGSGKSTWAKEFIAKNPTYKRVNNDELRLLLDGVRFDEKNENFIRVARNQLISAALGAHHNVLVDNCNLSPKAVAELERHAKAHGATLTLKDFTDVPYVTCLERDAKRANPVGKRVMSRMRDQFLSEIQPAGPVFDPALPSCVLVDMDGTLALKQGRGPYDFDRLHEDALNVPVANLVKRMNVDTPVIILTAREAKYTGTTMKWLRDHGVPHLFVLTREDGDKREDSIVKRELYEKHIAGNWNVEFILDDRDRVVRMWRSLGLPVFQVADGDF